MEQPEVLGDEKPSQRVYSRREKCIALFVGAVLVGYGYGTDLASGLLYAKLLEERSCTAENSANLSLASSVTTRRNWSLVATLTGISSVAGRTSTAEEEQERSKTLECGGLGEGVSATVWVTSIYTAVRCFSSPLGGIALDTFGSRGAAKLSAGVFMAGTTGSLLATEIFHLYFTASITGIGGALSTIVGFQILNSLCPHKKDILAGFVGFYVGVTVVIIAFVGTYAMKEAAWRGYYYTIDGIVALALAASIFLPKDMYTTYKMDEHLATGKSKCSLVVARFFFSGREFGRGFRRAFGLYRDVGFHLLNIAYAFYSLGAYFPFVFVAKQAKDFGASEAKANRQVVYVGPAVGIGAIIGCLVSNRLGIYPLVAQGMALIGLALATMSMAFVTNYNELLILVVAFSAFTGLSLGKSVSAAHQAIKNKQLAYHCLGHALLWSTIPILVAAPIAAFLYTVSGTYTVPYITGGACLAFGGVLLCMTSRRAQRLVNAAETT